MKKKILICTIMRNQENNIHVWQQQLLRLVEACPEYDFTISVYENDSTDETKKRILEFNKYCFSASEYICFSEILGTKQYGSIWSLDRIRNLANARQKCIDQVGHLDFDKIAFIEPDVEYDPEWCKELILARHPAQAGFIPHIYSGWSLRSLKNPKESCFLYDTCAVRQSANDTSWNFEKELEWRGKTLCKTYISDVDSNCVHGIWSTFNCFCVYDIAPFKQGLKWGWVNKRLNTGQEYVDDGDYGSGWLDADTVVICEDFRKMGFSNIALNTNCLVRHK